MKVLTVCQPYAELIARGVKRVENRTWWTSFRGPLAIHAGKSRKYMDDGYVDLFPGMTFGAVVAIVSLTDVVEGPSEAAAARYPWLRDHEHAEGPVCFILENVRRLDNPISLVGQRGLFEVPDLVEDSTAGLRLTRPQPRARCFTEDRVEKRTR